MYLKEIYMIFLHIKHSIIIGIDKIRSPIQNVVYNICDE